jgi:hypothetical protein
MQHEMLPAFFKFHFEQSQQVWYQYEDMNSSFILLIMIEDVKKVFCEFIPLTSNVCISSCGPINNNTLQTVKCTNGSP